VRSALARRARPAPEPAIVAALRGFREFGAATRTEGDGGVTWFVNEFWTARQRQAHSLHEISYRACFKPQLPRFFIDRLTEPGDVVHDPFMGRGTTPLEAALAGRAPAGSDVNPLSAMLVAPRLDPPTMAEIAARLDAIDWRREGEAPAELLAFFHPETLAAIAALRAHLAERPLERADAWIRMVALNRLTGHSPGFFSVYTLPPNQAVSAASQRKINAARGQTPPRRDVPALILRKSKSLLADGPPPPHPPARLATGAAARTDFLADASVDLVVTSPPFLDVVDYAGDNWLRAWLAGVDADAVPITIARREEDWIAFVRAALAELARVVRPGGHVAFEVGEVRGGRVLLERLVLDAAAGLPFAPLGVLVNAQDFTKTANCWGVANNAKGTNTNRVVILRRD
jgi:hypothetical protein